MARHPHADLMIKYANDSSLKVQWKDPYHREWKDIENPTWSHSIEYRIKSEPVKTYVFFVTNKDTKMMYTMANRDVRLATQDREWYIKTCNYRVTEIKEVVFEGETE